MENIGTKWHCALVSWTRSQCTRLVFGCALFWCHYVLLLLIPWYGAISPWWLRQLLEIVCSLLVILAYISSLSGTKQFWFCLYEPSWTFLFQGILFEYWIEHITFERLYVMLRFSTGISYRGVPGFTTACPCGVWWRGLTTCLLYVGPLFGNLVWNDSGRESLT